MQLDVTQRGRMHDAAIAAMIVGFGVQMV